MPGHNIIAIGASAGGVEALARLIGRLPGTLPASIFVVLHLPANGTSVLPAIFNRVGALPAKHAEEGEPIQRGHVYTAPPDHHLIVRRDRIRVVRGPCENGHRPAVDVLFRSAAQAYGRRVVGVVLSGTLDDGTAGLVAIKSRGGVAIVQDLEEALFSGMPQSALENAEVDYCLPVLEIAAVLECLAGETVDEEGAPPVSDEMRMETDTAEMEPGALQRLDRPGAPSGYTCPECKGALWELREGDLIRFRCRVGHAFSPDTLLEEQSQGLEAALWTALETLKEREALARRLIDRARRRGHSLAAQRFEKQAHDAERHAETIRQVLLKAQSVPNDGGAAGRGAGKEWNGAAKDDHRSAAGVIGRAL